MSPTRYLILLSFISCEHNIYTCMILHYVIFFLKINDDCDRWGGGYSALNVIKVTHRSIYVIYLIYNIILLLYYMLYGKKFPTKRKNMKSLGFATIMGVIFSVEIAATDASTRVILCFHCEIMTRFHHDSFWFFFQFTTS